MSDRIIVDKKEPLPETNALGVHRCCENCAEAIGCTDRYQLDQQGYNGDYANYCATHRFKRGRR